jgi:hypothetical protein
MEKLAMLTLSGKLIRVFYTVSHRFPPLVDDSIMRGEILTLEREIINEINIFSTTKRRVDGYIKTIKIGAPRNPGNNWYIFYDAWSEKSTSFP